MANRNAALMLVLGTMFFVFGIHSVDNAWNLHYVEKVTGGEWVDYTAAGQPLSANQSYSNGLLMIIGGFMLAVSGALWLYAPKIEKHKKYPDPKDMQPL